MGQLDDFLDSKPATGSGIGRIDSFLGPEPPTLAGEFGKGITAGVKGAQQAGYGIASMAGRAIGSDTLEDWGREGVQRKEAEMQQNPLAVGQIQDIGGVKDAALWAAGGLGQLVPFMATSALSGGVGGAIGGAVGKGAAAAAARQAVGEVAKRSVIQKAAQTGVQRGAVAGAGLSTTGMETGSIYADQLADGQTPDPGKALAYGIPAGLLDVLPQARVIGKVLGSGGPKVGVVRDILTQMGLEGSTEAAQTVLERMGANKLPFSEEGIWEAINAGAVGALGGGVIGGAGRGYQALRGTKEQAPAPIPDQSGAAPDSGTTGQPFQNPGTTGQSLPESGIDRPVDTQTGIQQASQPPAPIQRDETGQSVHPADTAVLTAQPGPLVNAAVIAATPQTPDTPSATESARLQSAQAEQQATAEQDQQAQQAAQEAAQQAEVDAVAQSRQEVLQRVLANEKDAEPTATFEKEVGAPTPDELKQLKHAQAVRTQKDREKTAMQAALEKAAPLGQTQAERDEKVGQRAKPAPASPTPTPAPQVQAGTDQSAPAKPQTGIPPASSVTPSAPPSAETTQPAARPTPGVASRQSAPSAQPAPTPAPDVSPPSRASKQLAPESPSPTPKSVIQAPIVAPKSGDVAKDKTAENFADWAGKVAKRQAMEAHGQDILDDMDQRGIKPQDAAKQFWSDTYFKLPAQAQDRFQRMLKAHTGLQPGDPIARNTKTGEVTAARDWQDIASLIDVGDSAANLAGTERGFVALMQDGNRRLAGESATPNAPVDSTGTPPQWDGVVSRLADEWTKADRGQRSYIAEKAGLGEAMLGKKSVAMHEWADLPSNIQRELAKSRLPTSPPQPVNAVVETPAAKSPDSDALKSAHEAIIRGKAQTDTMQRRIIDAAAADAAKIRAGKADLSAKYAKSLRSRADTIAKWDTKAADAVRVLADHIDSVRPKSQMELNRAAKEQADAEKKAENARRMQERREAAKKPTPKPAERKAADKQPDATAKTGRAGPKVVAPSEGGKAFALAKPYDRAKDARKAIAFYGLDKTHAPAHVGSEWKILPKAQAAMVRQRNARSRQQAEEARTPGQANNTLLKRLFHKFGIQVGEVRDISGEGSGSKTGAMVGTFRKDGRGVDEWGRVLVSEGWLSPMSDSERGNENIEADVDDVRALMRKVFDGEEVFPAAEQDSSAEKLAQDEWAERESDVTGGKLSPEEIAELTDPELTREENEQAFDAARFLSEQGLNEGQIERIIERASIQDGNYEESIRSLAAAESGNAQGAGAAQAETLTLTGQTNAEALAAEKVKPDQAADDKRLADAQVGGFSLSPPKGAVTQAAVNNPKNQGDVFGNRADQSNIVLGNIGDGRDLIIQHNVTAANLLHADRMGGLAVPSLAITKAADTMTNFGEITLIGRKEMADPNGYANTKVFGADIYSPRYPKVSYQFSNRAAVEASLGDAIKATTRVDWDAVADRGADQLHNEPAVMWAFLQERGIKPTLEREKGITLKRVGELRKAGLAKFFPKPGQWLDKQSLARDPEFQRAAIAAHNAQFADAMDTALRLDMLADFDTADDSQRRSIASSVAYEVEKVGKPREVNVSATRDAMRKQIRAKMDEAFNEYAETLFEKLDAKGRIFQGFTYSGNRRYKAHTLDNVVAILKKDLRGGEGFNYGVGSLRAHFTPQFKSITQIRKEKGRIVSHAEFEKIKAEVDTDLKSIWDDLRPYHGQGNQFGFGDTIIDTLQRSGSQGINRALKENQFDAERVPQETKQKIAEFLTRLRNLPTEYFEAKITRAVGLEEFRAAVVPSDTSQRVLDVLKKHGIEVATYKKGANGEEGNRQKMVADVSSKFADDVLFNQQADRAPAAPLDRHLYSMVNSGATAAELLHAIATQSKSKLNRAIAHLLIRAKINPTVIMGAIDPDYKFATGNDGGYSASYVPEKDLVTLHSFGKVETDLIHEFMHSATVAAIRRKGMASVQMQALFKHVEKFIADHPELQGQYGMERIEEFVSEAFSNPKFQEMLKGIPAKASGPVRSAWEWFANIVRSILGVHPSQSNAFLQALEIGGALVEENMAATREGGAGALGSYRVKGMDGVTFAKTHGNPLTKAYRAIQKAADAGEITPDEYRDQNNAAANAFLDDVAKRFGDPETAERMFQRLGLYRKTEGFFRALEGFIRDHIELAIKTGPDRQSFQGAMKRLAASYSVGDTVSSIMRSDFSDEAQNAAKNMMAAMAGELGYKIGSGRPQLTGPQSLGNRAQQLTDAFKRWFAGSRVVDKDGAPLVVYHGKQSEGAITQFKDRMTWFIDNPDYASTWANLVGPTDEARAQGTTVLGAPTVYPVYLSIQNPYDTSGNLTFKGDPIDAENTPYDAELREYLESLGYDGIKETQFGANGKPRETLWIAFRPKQQVKSATGNSGAYDPNNPSILGNRAGQAITGAMKAVTESKTIIPDFAKGYTPEQQATLRKVGMVHEQKSLAGRAQEMFATFRKSFVQGMVDQYAPLKELGQKVYILARMSTASDGALEAALMYGKPVLDADGAIDVTVNQGGGFLDAMKKLEGEHDRFFAWIAGNRAAALKAQGKENLLTDDDISFLKDLNAGKMNDGKSRAMAYAEAFGVLRMFNKATLDIAEKSGLIDAESRPIWEQEFYVPFYRNLESGVSGATKKSGLVNQEAFKTLKGGSDNLNDLFKNTLMNWSHLLSASAKNRAAAAALQAAEQAGIALEANEDTVRQMGKSIGTKAVSYMDEGVRRWYLVSDPHVMDAIASLEWGGFGPMMKPLRLFKRMLSFGVTISPTYKAANVMRDTVTAIATTPVGYNPLQNVIQGWKATQQGSQVYVSMLAGGGAMRFGTSIEGDRAEHVKHIVNAGISDKQVLDTKEKIAALGTKIWDAYKEFGDRAENINRAALYEQLKAKGMSHLEASYMARDLMDFSLQGKWAVVRFLTQTVPFMNARLQGLYKLGRASTEDRARFAAVTGAVVMTSLALLWMQGDDDDWKKREDWDRNNYWAIKIGGVMFYIPKPFEIGAIGTMAERSWELMFDKEMTGGKYWGNVGQLVANNFAMSPIPQLMKPLFDVYSNKDSFSGRQIETMGMERLKPEDRSRLGTSELARLFGQLGLPEPGSAMQGRYKALSPVQWDALMQGYFGSLAFGVNMVTDAIMRPLMDRPTRPDMTLNQYPILGRFVKELPQGQSKYVTQFYDEAVKIEEAYASYRDALKRGDPERAAEILADDKDKIGKYRQTEAVRRSMSMFNRQLKAVQDNRTMTGAEKRDRIEQIQANQDRVARAITARQ